MTIKRFQSGGSTVPGFGEYGPGTTPGAGATDPFEIGSAGQSSIDEDLRKMLQMAASSANSPPSKEKISQYAQQLKDLSGQPRRSNFYDLASTVGRTMLQADPTTGPFAAMGLGLSNFSEEERKKRAAIRAEQRAIAMKAFELAKSDQDRAAKYLNDASLQLAKLDNDNKISFYRVTHPTGINMGGVTYAKGDQIPLTEKEAKANRTRITESKGSGWKVTGTGASATWQSQEDAENIILGLGLKKDSPFFDRAVAQISTIDPTKVGTPIIIGGAYTELTPLVSGDEVFNIIISPTSGGASPVFTRYREKRVDAIAKTQTTYNETATKIIPAVNRAMNILRTQPIKTGGLTEAIKPSLSVFTQLFGLDDENLTSLDILEATSNYLGPKMRPIGSGSTSDVEFRAYKQAILSLGNTPKANYVILYAFKKMAEKAAGINQKELELLTDDRYSNAIEVNNALKAWDPGIFEKFPENIDRSDSKALEKFLYSLPDGVVVDNSEGVFGDAPFIIIGWMDR